MIDFRDEQSDGNGGTGMLYINNTAATPNVIEHYRIDGELGYTWKSYGPYCAFEGWHNLSYTSDANPGETSFSITDSFGLIKAKGGMSDFPVTFHTLKPSKFCTPDNGLSALQLKQRNRKLIAANDQFTPRDRLVAGGFGVLRAGVGGARRADSYAGGARGARGAAGPGAAAAPAAPGPGWRRAALDGAASRCVPRRGLLSSTPSRQLV